MQILITMTKTVSSYDLHSGISNLYKMQTERKLLLRSTLVALSSNETALATDYETSLILERLLYSMDDFARRVLADRFTGQ